MWITVFNYFVFALANKFYYPEKAKEPTADSCKTEQLKAKHLDLLDSPKTRQEQWKV